MVIRTPVQGVFHAAVGSYNLNYYDAQRLCEIHGATLATYNQLYKAWQAGLETCRYVNLILPGLFFIRKPEGGGWGRREVPRIHAREMQLIWYVKHPNAYFSDRHVPIMMSCVSK